MKKTSQLFETIRIRRIQESTVGQESFRLVSISADTLLRMRTNTRNSFAFSFFTLTSGRRQCLSVCTGVHSPNMIDHSSNSADDKEKFTTAVRQIGIHRVEHPFQSASEISLYKPRVGCRLNRPVRFTAEPLPVSYPQSNFVPDRRCLLRAPV